jgi:hypothetical protein
MGKKKKRHINLMRDWPTDETCGVRYEDLIYPLKKIMHEGYRIERLPVSQFIYTGYNIGEEEYRYYSPTPQERFAHRWLDNEKKQDRTLLDNVLVTTFQLGMEQGRRLGRTQNYSNQLLEDMLKSKSNTIKKLKATLSQYDPAYAEDPPTPMESEDAELLIEDFESELINVDV